MPTPDLELNMRAPAPRAARAKPKAEEEGPIELAVDVRTGVERDGHKDRGKMRDFVRAVRGTDEQ